MYTGYQPYPPNRRGEYLPTMEQHTGYSAPPSELDGTLLDSSGLSSATAKAAPWKKQRATPAAPALVATLEIINQHNSILAVPTNISSGSEILSVTSSKERQRRVQLAKAREETSRLRLELAEAREAVAQTELDHTPSELSSWLGRTSR